MAAPHQPLTLRRPAPATDDLPTTPNTQIIRLPTALPPTRLPPPRPPRHQYPRHPLSSPVPEQNGKNPPPLLTDPPPPPPPPRPHPSPYHPLSQPEAPLSPSRATHPTTAPPTRPSRRGRLIAGQVISGTHTITKTKLPRTAPAVMPTGTSRRPPPPPPWPSPPRNPPPPLAPSRAPLTRTTPPRLPWHRGLTAAAENICCRQAAARLPASELFGPRQSGNEDKGPCLACPGLAHDLTGGLARAARRKKRS